MGSDPNVVNLSLFGILAHSFCLICILFASKVLQCYALRLLTRVVRQYSGARETILALLKKEVAMCRKLIFNSIISSITTLLKDAEFLSAFRFPGRFTRSGKLSMIAVILFLLNSTKQKMDTNIDNLWDTGYTDFPRDISRQAVSKARHGIRPELFSTLFDLSVDIFYNEFCDGKNLWKGKYGVFGIDGSKIEVPNSKSNFEKFGEMFSRNNPNRRWSQALLSTIYDVSNDFIAHAVIKPFLGSERDAAISHCEELERTGILGSNSILVFDRGYYSEAIFRYFHSKGYLCVMRLQERIGLSKRSKGDSQDVLKGNPKEETEDIPIRVIRTGLGNGVTEYLATNIFDKSLGINDFKELYFLRWGCEGKYRELKCQVCLEEFVGYSSISVEQEVFISLLYSNLASLVKNQADKEIEASANPENKYRYQANRAYIIGRIRTVFVHALLGLAGEEDISHIFSKAARVKSQIQPGRSRTRNKMKRDRAHFNNRKACFA